jgi:hypothetical protein
MWPYKNLPMPAEIGIDLSKSMKEKMPSPKPKIVVTKSMEEWAPIIFPVGRYLNNKKTFI